LQGVYRVHILIRFKPIYTPVSRKSTPILTPGQPVTPEVASSSLVAPAT